MTDEEKRRGPTKKSLENDPKPGTPKRAHREYVSQGKNLNKDTRRELREKH